MDGDKKQEVVNTYAYNGVFPMANKKPEYNKVKQNYVQKLVMTLAIAEVYSLKDKLCAVDRNAKYYELYIAHAENLVAGRQEFFTTPECPWPPGSWLEKRCFIFQDIKFKNKIAE